MNSRERFHAFDKSLTDAGNRWSDRVEIAIRRFFIRVTVFIHYSAFTCLIIAGCVLFIITCVRFCYFFVNAHSFYTAPIGLKGTETNVGYPPWPFWVLILVAWGMKRKTHGVKERSQANKGKHALKPDA